MHLQNGIIPIGNEMDISTFIKENADRKPNELRLKYHGKDLGFDLAYAITQIESRGKFRHKLPAFTAAGLVFPDSLAGEQATHEGVARWHANMAGVCGNVIDLTAGLGMDTFALADKALHVTACEKDSLRARALEANTKALGLEDKVAVAEGDCMDTLRGGEDRFDLAFIDPARRDGNNSRVYNLRDCTPDVTELLPEIMAKCSRLLIKASPMLDVSQTARDIPGLTALYAVSVKGECKEVLAEVGPSSTAIRYEAVDLTPEGEGISCFGYNADDAGADVVYAEASDIVPGAWLYEPNASVMKLGCWHQMQSRWPGLRKLDKSSHLFVSDALIPDFPGRGLRITGVPTGRGVKRLKGTRANVVSRNHPLGADALRRQLGVAEGDTTFIYGTRMASKPVLIVAERVS